ncbi:MAG: hypothetical protein OXI30_01755 [Chloroflexota bacterium]|nr:hypothetical protein [Chloroflexota bacterium]
MQKNEKASQVGTGVFFVGLGLLFFTGWWWPGIMFVIAASMLAGTIAAGESWTSATGALWLIGIGVVFGIPGLIGDIAGAFWQIFPLILIGMGLFMLFGGKYRPKVSGKRKNDDDIHKV